MKNRAQFLSLILSIIAATFFAAVARGADEPPFPVLHPANPGLIETLPAIPFEWLIRRELGGVDPNADAIQKRPNPLAPLDPDLVAAYKAFRGLAKDYPTYAGARKQYLDLLEDKGDPTGLLPTREEIDGPSQQGWQRTFRSPPKPLTMLDENTLNEKISVSAPLRRSASSLSTTARL
jgi:hypothetical protein